MPSPKKGEKRKDFLSRCMGDSEARGDFPRSDQRYAFCISQWDRRKKKKNNEMDNTGSLTVSSNTDAGLTYYVTTSTDIPLTVPESGDVFRSEWTFRLNAGMVQEVEENGRQYLVAPVVAIREGVLNGEFVPAQEIALSTENWNGVPITLGHPKLYGMLVPLFQHPELTSDFVIGEFRNVSFDGKALHGEVWIDVELAEEKGADGEFTLNQLQNEDQMDVSTGYAASVINQNGVFGDKAFSGVQRGLVPDHLALLPFERGACSWEDGCGTPRMNEESDEFWEDVGDKTQLLMDRQNRRSSARTPKYSGTEETSWASVSKSFTAYRDGYYKHSGTSKPSDPPSQVKDAPSAMKSWIASKTLLGDASATTTSDLISFPVVNPGTNKLNAGALRNAASRAGSMTGETKNSIQRVVTRLLNKHFRSKSMRKEDSKIENKALEALKWLGGALGFSVHVDDQAEIKQTISDCCRCGEDHSDLVFQRFSQSEEGCPFDIWAFCPNTEEPILSVHQLKVNGAKLGTLLTQYVKDQTTDERPRRTIIKEMAEKAGTSVEKVKSIIAGEVKLLPNRWLTGFAQALDVSMWDLMMAQELDSREFMKETMTSEPTDAERPVAMQAEEEEVVEDAGEVAGEETEPAEVTLNTEEVEIMPEIRELADAVLANESLSFTEEDREWLESLPEDKLQRMMAQVSEEPTEEPVTEEPAETPAAPQTMDELLASVENSALKAEMEDIVRTNNEIRTNLISQITENSEFTEEELSGKSVSELKKLAALAAKQSEAPTPSYIGAGVPRQQTQKETDGPPEPLKIVTRPRVEKQETSVN